MPDTAYWRVHVRVNQDALSTLMFTRAREDSEEPGDVSAEALQVYRGLVGLPEEWTVHVEVATLTGPEDALDAPGGALGGAKSAAKAAGGAAKQAGKAASTRASATRGSKKK